LVLNACRPSRPPCCRRPSPDGLAGVQPAMRALRIGQRPVKILALHDRSRLFRKWRRFRPGALVPLARDDTGTALTDPLPFSAPSLILHSFPLIPALALRRGPTLRTQLRLRPGPPPDIRAHQLSHPLWLLWLVSPLFSSIHPRDRPCARTGAWPDTGLAAKCGQGRLPSPCRKRRAIAHATMPHRNKLDQSRASGWIARAALRLSRSRLQGNRSPPHRRYGARPAAGIHDARMAAIPRRFSRAGLSSTVKCGSKRRKPTVLRLSPIYSAQIRR
jgi:hypothetical protein